MDGSLADFTDEIARYKKILAENERDLQILGLGVNGHLGANEPGTPFDARLFWQIAMNLLSKAPSCTTT